MRKPTMLGAAAVAVTMVAGYLLLVSPQAGANATVQAQLDGQAESNAAASAQIPILKAQLENITGSVDGLRTLSGQVPPTIDLPELYRELDAVAASVGGGVAVISVSVTVPALITSTAAPALAEGTTADPNATAAPAPVADSAVLASYSVNMDVKATPTQAAAFIKALGATKRMSVIASSGVTAGGEGDNDGTAHVSATLFLQQVDVDGLAAQIEALAAAKGVDG